MAEQVDALRAIIDRFDPEVLLPAYKAALSSAVEPVEVEVAVKGFVRQVAPVLDARAVPVLPNLESHLTASVEKQLASLEVSDEALALALVQRNWLATAVMGAYKASEEVEPLSQDRVVAMKQARVEWLQANGLVEYTDVIASLYQRISDDADVYQTEAASTFGRLQLPALSELGLAGLLLGKG